MPQGTPHAITAEGVEQLADCGPERRGGARRRPLRPRTHDGRAAAVQDQAGRGAGVLRRRPRARAGNLGEVQIEVVPAESRDLTRRRDHPPLARGGGADPRRRGAGLQLVDPERRDPRSRSSSAGRDLDELRAAAQLLKLAAGALSRSASTSAIRSAAASRSSSSRSCPPAEALGLSAHDLGRQVRQAFHGEEAQRVQRGRDDVRVMVRYPAAERRSLAAPGEHANPDRGRHGGPLRQCGADAASARASPASAASTADASSAWSHRSTTRPPTPTKCWPPFGRGRCWSFRSDFPDVGVSFGGEQREQSEFLASLAKGWLLALFVIFALIAIPLGSYSQPLHHHVRHPLRPGRCGLWGHILMRYDFSMMSVIGIVAVSGVVVNDSLVLVDQVNKNRAQGSRRWRRSREAWRARFRAIMLTSLTTFAGLTPLLLETSVQSRLLIPMAISLAFGVLFATSDHAARHPGPLPDPRGSPPPGEKRSAPAAVTQRAGAPARRPRSRGAMRGLPSGLRPGRSTPARGTRAGTRP